MQYKVVRLPPNVKALEVLHSLSPEKHLIVAAQLRVTTGERMLVLTFRSAIALVASGWLLVAGCWPLSGNTRSRARF
jgi:hypothetical protein